MESTSNVHVNINDDRVLFPGPLPGTYDIFEKIELGVLMLDYKEKRITFSNKHFHSMARGNEGMILDHIFNCLGSKRKCVFREVELDVGICIGYSVYRVSEVDYLVLVNNISNRKIFLETQGENQYYNKLSAFMAEISHEIGNPLTTVITTLQVLLKNMSEWTIDKQSEYIQRSINELKRLSKFLKKLRTLSRENKIEKKTTCLKSFIDGFISQNGVLMDTGEISFVNNVDESTTVVIDEDSFYQVLYNLVRNSIDCFPGTDVKGVIWVGVEEVNEFFVKLVYKNNGPLIPVEILEKIFMPFFSTKGDGRGMGLNISRKLMTRMGGTIKTEMPGDGWGAKFVLYIPIEEENERI